MRSEFTIMGRFDQDDLHEIFRELKLRETPT